MTFFPLRLQGVEDFKSLVPGFLKEVREEDMAGTLGPQTPPSH